MILLDEIDVKEKYIQRESLLPPYSPSGYFDSSSRTALTQGRTCSSSRAYISQPHYRTSSPHSLSSSPSSLTLASTAPSPSLAPSGSGSTASSSSTFSPLPHRSAPPPNLRASNNVYIQRDVAAITGTYLIDPTLYVPMCLLPDPDLDLSMDARGKGKGRSNLSFVTGTGDIYADVWIRDGCASRGRRRRRRGTSRSGSWSSGGDVCVEDVPEESGEQENYWGDGWTSPPPSHPWPRKSLRQTEIAVKSATGFVTLRVHAQSHQRLRIRVSAEGPISIGVPRTFVGFVFANSQVGRTDSVDSSSGPGFMPGPGPGSGWGAGSGFGQGYGWPTSVPGGAGMGRGLPSPLDAGIMSTTNLLLNGSEAVLQAFAMRLPVQFSPGMEDNVTAEHEQRRSRCAQGRYYVGDPQNRVYSEHQDGANIDELYIESRAGPIGVSYNDETLFAFSKPNGLITKILNKARS